MKYQSGNESPDVYLPDREPANDNRFDGKNPRFADLGVSVPYDEDHAFEEEGESHGHHKRLVHRQHLIVLRAGGDIQVCQVDTSPTAPVFEALFASGVFNQNPAHGFCRGSEEVAATVPGLARIASESEPGLVNQGCGLQRLTGCFVRHFERSQPAQFIVDQGDQLLGRVSFPSLNRIQDDGDVSHASGYSSIQALASQ